IRQHYGAEQFHLVGHDWGGAVAWWYALHHEAKLKSLSILNLPHPLAFLTKLKGSPIQMLKSWYMFYFQIPFIPELFLKLGRFAILKQVLTRSSTRNAYDQQDFANLEEAWSEPGAIKAMVNYYRALLRNLRLPTTDGTLHLPVQILWGEKDLALSVQGAHDSMPFLTNGTLTVYPDATHWLAHDKPDIISQRLIQHAQANENH
ncbi:MAG: alpha/beta hydrolase, partial [Venatoribacter sp.]